MRVIQGVWKHGATKSSAVWFGFHFFNRNNTIHFVQTAIKDTQDKKQKYRKCTIVFISGDCLNLYF
tara:strand:- start:214 stop:411 length:198 start_codon:yes stop_codon:yes gene_type:complete